MRLEGFFASFSPSLDPVAHRSLAHAQCHSYVFLLPPFLFQFPRSFASFFSPIGFLWCSHASYRITLDFLLPRSVALPAFPLYPDRIEGLIAQMAETKQLIVEPGYGGLADQHMCYAPA